MQLSERKHERITTRLVVAATVVVAFVITALSGLVLYRPVQLLPAFGISLLTWRSIHDWGALVLTAAVIVHLILHRRRVGQMVAGLARPARPPQSARPPMVGRPQESAEGVGAGVRRAGGAPSARDAQAVPHRVRRVAGRLRRRLRRRRGSLRGGGGARRTAASGGIPGSTSFPALNVEQAPHVRPEQWLVTVDGLVDKPLRLDHAAWSALARRNETADFHCVEGWTVDRLRWGGVAPRTILDMAGLQPTATYVNFHALGGTYAEQPPAEPRRRCPDRARRHP